MLWSVSRLWGPFCPNHRRPSLIGTSRPLQRLVISHCNWPDTIEHCVRLFTVHTTRLCIVCETQPQAQRSANYITARGAAIMREVYAFATAEVLGKHAWPGAPVSGHRQPKHTAHHM